MNAKMRIFLLIVLPFLSAASLSAQLTVGVTHYEDSLVQDGYNLYFPHNQSNVYLLDNCGRVVNVWEDSTYIRPGNSVYLTEQGKLIKASRHQAVGGDVIWAGGGGEFVDIFDWNGNREWHFELNDSLARLHHDIAPMPNGNILMIAWERKLLAEAIAAGRDTANGGMVDDDLWPEMLIEVQPIGADSFDIVWEWHAWDHLIQDFDNSKANFGVVAGSPGKIDLNFLGASGGRADWLHFNAIDYNPNLDMIVVSNPEFNEVWMIDHSTTTAQAASSSGGLSGKGGDLIFRWGSPMAYRQGDSTDIQLNFQHDIHWMDIDLPSSDPDYGKLLVFNNRIGGNYSTVNIIQPIFDSYNYEWLKNGPVWAPAGPAWTYTAPNPTDFYSQGLAGAQKLKNGNFLICSGRQGWTFEVTPDDSIVWEYRNPIIQGTAVAQGASITPNSNFHFRMNRYSPQYPGLVGKDLSPGDFLELSPDTAYCPSQLASRSGRELLPALRFFPNPASQRVVIEGARHEEGPVLLTDLTGRVLTSTQMRAGQAALDLNGLAPGIYLLQFSGHLAGKLIVNQ